MKPSSLPPAKTGHTERGFARGDDSPRTVIRINDVIEDLLVYHPAADTNLVERAYVFSAKVHQGQTRLSGEPYLTHPLQVAHILTRMKLDEVCIATGLLHDTLEDTPAKPEELVSLFGQEIATLVDGLTKIGKMSFSSFEEQQAENFRKMILAMAKDIRVILVKLADRLHNMRTLEFLPSEKQRSIAQETIEVYSPIANRLGVDWIKTELEDLAFKHLHPKEFLYLDEMITSQRQAHQQYVEEVKKIISAKLAPLHTSPEILGRLKHYYSVYKKMLRQQVDFDQVYDLIAFRVIVESIKDCYGALGIIHSVWKPVPGRFKDFIAMPKSNMYQSLHTTVIGPYGERMEIQIRTREMHRIAEEGIAAHWRYKEGREIEKRDDQLFSWLRRMLEWQQELRDPREFLETFRTDLFPDEVYVFTPKGEVKAFPQGATPIDFAYGIHTTIGHQCIGARANGRMVPLTYQLKNGDTLEIVTSKTQRPSKDWLSIAKTPRAKTKIRQWLRSEQRIDSIIQAGRDSCEREFKRHNLNFTRLCKAGKVAKVLDMFGVGTLQELLSGVGQGKISVTQLAQKFIAQAKEGATLGIEREARPEVRKKKPADDSNAVQVKGLSQILVSFAKCCNPLPGDNIVGYITKGRGVSVHAKACPRLLETDQERRVEVTWNMAHEVSRIVKIKVVSHDQPGLLAEMSAAISKEKSNIRRATVVTTEDHQGISIFEVEVKSVDHIETILKALKEIKGVYEAHRIKI